MLRRVPRPLLPFALALAVHLGALRGGFHFDDVHSIVSNEALRDLRNVPRFFVDPSLFSSSPEGAMYRPLTLALHAANQVQAGTGGSATPFLLTNLLLHASAAAAFLVLVRGLLRRAGSARADGVALGASLLFAVHPLASEVVNYVSARSSSLSTLLLFLGLTAHLRGREGRPAALVGAVVLGVGALLARETAIVLPGLVALIEALLPGTNRRRVARTALYAVVAAASLALRQSIASTSVPLPDAGRANFEPEAGWGRSLGANAGMQVVAAARFLGLFVWPRGLSVDPPVPTELTAASPTFLLALATVAAGLAGWVLARRRAAVAFGGGLVVLGLAPYFVVPLNVAMAEHRLYLPLAGLCLATADLAVAAAARVRLRVPRGSLAFAASLVLGLLAVRSAVRDADWRGGADDLGLWESALEVSPASFRAHLGAGNIWFGRGDLDRAESHFRAALAVYPGYDAARLSLVASLTRRDEPGALREAIAHLEEILRRRPEHVLARFKLALALQALYLRTGEGSAARRCDEILAALAAENPGDPRAALLLREFAHKRGQATFSGRGLPFPERAIPEK